MSAAVVYYEYGFRTDQTGEVWAEDYGPYGVWTPNLPEHGIRNVDIYDDAPAAIRRELIRAGVKGDVLRRKVTVTRGEAQVVVDA
jgi:hypothetical protein